MKKPVLLASVLLAAVTGAAFAAPISVEGLSATYVPGAFTTFNVVLPEMTNLGAYNIDLVLSGTEGVAGVDYFFDVGATPSAVTRYVFPSAANFFAAANVDSAVLHRLTLSDFDLVGADVAAGVNDHVALVTIGTSAGFSGMLSLSFDTSGLILDTPDVAPTPVTGFAGISADTEAQGVVTLTMVPEPRSALSLLLGGALTAAGSTRRASVRQLQACQPNAKYV